MGRFPLCGWMRLPWEGGHPLACKWTVVATGVLTLDVKDLEGSECFVTSTCYSKLGRWFACSKKALCFPTCQSPPPPPQLSVFLAFHGNFSTVVKICQIRIPDTGRRDWHVGAPPQEKHGHLLCSVWLRGGLKQGLPLRNKGSLMVLLCVSKFFICRSFFKKIGSAQFCWLSDFLMCRTEP